MHLLSDLRWQSLLDLQHMPSRSEPVTGDAKLAVSASSSSLVWEQHQETRPNRNKRIPVGFT